MTEHIIRSCDAWTLAYNDDNLEARKEMSYGGAMVWTSEQNAEDHGPDVRYNLSERDVVKE